LKKTGIIFFLLLVAGVIMLQAEDLDVTRDHEMQSNDTEEKSGTFPTSWFSFYFRQKFQYEGYEDEVDDLDLLHQVSFLYVYKRPKFRLDIRVSDYFISDFSPLTIDATNPDTSTDLAASMFYNSFSTSITTRFDLGRVMKLGVSLYLGLDAPFDGSLLLKAEPNIHLQGSYWFGLFWEAHLGAPIDGTAYPDGSYDSYGMISISTYGELGYEFFRFFGPKKFKFSILVESSFLASFYSPPVFDNRIEHRTVAGFRFNWFKFEQRINFVHYTQGLLNLNQSETTSELIVSSPGIEIEWFTKIKWFSFSISYEGWMNIADSNPAWMNRTTVYVMFHLVKSRRHGTTGSTVK
jgi:hypothetical protein